MNLSGVGFEHIWSRVYMVHVPCCPLGRHTHFFMTTISVVNRVAA
jgi:hypothetical protein